MNHNSLLRFPVSAKLLLLQVHQVDIGGVWTEEEGQSIQFSNGGIVTTDPLLANKDKFPVDGTNSHFDFKPKPKIQLSHQLSVQSSNQPDRKFIEDIHAILYIRYVIADAIILILLVLFFVVLIRKGKKNHEYDWRKETSQSQLKETLAFSFG